MEGVVAKDHGFVIKNVAEATMIDYLDSIKEIVGAENIINIGKVASNYGVWVKNDEVSKKLKILEVVTVKEQSVSIWPYAQPIKKVKLIGVPPFLNNNLIIQELNQYGKVKSDIDTEPLYGALDEYTKHIGSFTRSLLMSFSKDIQLPESIIVRNDDTNHEIRTQVGWRKCFYCGSFTHVGANCTTKKVTSYAIVVKKQGASLELDNNKSQAADSNASSSGIAENSAASSATHAFERGQLQKIIDELDAISPLDKSHET
ncbi:unnamed protein product [Allacma fusca]|uniref:CCHC-type domain-containing protein n=1 Tax=Allacma fusca TaxID=39272 RepID=A0A8J2PD11_9HEXA|nr:unnamed protein product [Allacma fusca]